MAKLSDMLTYLRQREGLTQQELADKLGITRSAIGMYETGKREPDLETQELFADFYNVDMNTLTGHSSSKISIPGIMPPPKTYKVPRLGTIACGEPILAEENIEGYDEVPEQIHCNFTLKCKGDSMTGARINDGDIVYIRLQPDVENGEIAAVLIDEATEISGATLKRVYKYPDHIELHAENPKIQTRIYIKEDMNRVRIVGKAVGFTSVIK